jgi:hypothetical protein
MQSNSVTHFPLSRDAIRRHAVQDAKDGKPIGDARGLSGNDRICYEHAYTAFLRDEDAVRAECA